jgi:formylglycine-generating enzyme required for sulfatase activity
MIEPRIVALKNLIESGDYNLAQDLASILESYSSEQKIISLVALVKEGKYIAAHSQILTSFWVFNALDSRLIEQGGEKAGEKINLKGLECSWCPIGTYLMGSPDDEISRKPDETLHRVTLINGFWILDHPITRSEFVIRGSIQPMIFDIDYPDLPMTGVTWQDAVTFCEALTCEHHEHGVIPWQMQWRLPTEAEWEYAARCGGDWDNHNKPLDSIAWYDDNMDGAIKPVKQKEPNAWDIYDMIGNVWEWCYDWYGPYSLIPITDPKGPETGEFKVNRGGSYDNWSNLNEVTGYRAAARDGNEPTCNHDGLGFRPVLVCKSEKRSN